MNVITTLFFDVGGVCLTNGWDEESRRLSSEYFKYDFNEVENRHQNVFEDFEKNLISRDEYLDEVIFHKKRKFNKEEFIRFMEDQSKPIKKTFEILVRIKETGNYLMATINNETYELNEYRFQKYKLHQFFEAFFTSAYVRARKPEPEIYETALKVLYKNPQECLFIDDRIENIEAAKKFGINTIHLPEVYKLEEKLKENKIKF